MRRLYLLFLLALSLPPLLGAREIRGVVKSGCRRLSGVMVTDGTSFVRTDRRGRFVLDAAPDARFVSVVTPSGYMPDFSDGAPQFYRRLSDRPEYRFDLRKFDCGRPGKEVFRILAVADPQTQTEAHFRQFCGAPLEALISHSKACAARSAAVGVTLGDIAWDDVAFLPRYKAEIRRTGIPFFAVIGNHDFNPKKSGQAAAEEYEASYGPVNWAAFLGGSLLIGLNVIRYRTDRAYEEGYDEATLAWVERLLRLIPKTTPLLIFQHSPLNLWREDRWAENSGRMRTLLEGRKVDFITGHRHYQNEMVYSEHIRDHNIASYCGTFWKSDRSADGTPRGFEIFTSEGGKLSWRYQSIGRPADYQMEVCGPGEAVVHKDCVVANIWDADEDWVIEWYQDGRPMGPMEPCMDAFPSAYEAVMKGFGVRTIEEVHWAYRPAPLMHYYLARPEAEAKSVRVHVENPFGKVWDYEVDLTAAPGRNP